MRDWRRKVKGLALDAKNFCRIPSVGGDMLVEMTTTDLELLRQFTREHSQEAFTTLVKRQVNLVYSTALRQVRSPQLAEEIAQSVFADLARDAGKLKPDTILTAWLYQVTSRTAVDAIRKESRRQLREQIAVEMTNMNATANDWRQIEPLLDDAMAALDETDRAAILLRYFENKSLREVGEALGASDDAAQKRVSRAVERLREFFSKRNITDWRERTGRFDFRQCRSSRAGRTGRHHFRRRCFSRNGRSHFNCHCRHQNHCHDHHPKNPHHRHARRRCWPRNL